MAKIIIVDDDPAMVAVLSEVLREHRHEVIPASSPERAMQLTRDESPDLVLADVEMPEGKPLGLKLLQQVKEHNRSIPVVMITGQGTKERAVQALRAGAQDFIEKPFQIDELVKRVDNALVQQKAVHALEENVELRRQLQEKFRFDSMIGTTAPHGVGVSPHRARGQHRFHRADSRRKWHGQGTGRPRTALQQPPRGHAVRRGQLQRPSRAPARVGTVRSSQGRVYRGGLRQGGPVPACRWRHDSSG